MVIMKVGDLVRLSPFITTDPANQKGKVGVIVEIVNNNGLEIVKVKFNNECYGLYDGDTLEKVTTKSKEQ